MSPTTPRTRGLKQKVIEEWNYSYSKNSVPMTAGNPETIEGKHHKSLYSPPLQLTRPISQHEFPSFPVTTFCRGPREWQRFTLPVPSSVGEVATRKKGKQTARITIVSDNVPSTCLPWDTSDMWRQQHWFALVPEYQACTYSRRKFANESNHG